MEDEEVILKSQGYGIVNGKTIYLFQVQIKKTSTFKYYKRAEGNSNFIRISEQEFNNIKPIAS